MPVTPPLGNDLLAETEKGSSTSSLADTSDEHKKNIQNLKLKLLIRHLRKSRVITVGVVFILTCLISAGMIEIYLRCLFKDGVITLNHQSLLNIERDGYGNGNWNGNEHNGNGNDNGKEDEEESVWETESDSDQELNLPGDLSPLPLLSPSGIRIRNSLSQRGRNSNEAHERAVVPELAINPPETENAGTDEMAGDAAIDSPFEHEQEADNSRTGDVNEEDSTSDISQTRTAEDSIADLETAITVAPRGTSDPRVRTATDKGTEDASTLLVDPLSDHEQEAAEQMDIYETQCSVVDLIAGPQDGVEDEIAGPKSTLLEGIYGPRGAVEEDSIADPQITAIIAEQVLNVIDKFIPIRFESSPFNPLDLTETDEVTEDVTTLLADPLSDHEQLAGAAETDFDEGDSKSDTDSVELVADDVGPGGSAQSAGRLCYYLSQPSCDSFIPQRVPFSLAATWGETTDSDSPSSPTSFNCLRKVSRPINLTEPQYVADYDTACPLFYFIFEKQDDLTWRGKDWNIRRSKRFSVMRSSEQIVRFEQNLLLKYRRSRHILRGGIPGVRQLYLYLTEGPRPNGRLSLEKKMVIESDDDEDDDA